jgi:alpha-1,2-mannosyltransferase
VTRYAGTQRAISEPPALSRDLGGEALRAYGLSPPGLVTLAATVVALAIRLYLLSRLRYLTGITEYDDGVYLGGSVSLISGTLPYHGFAFVQPPGILLLMAPAALLAKVSAITNAMAVARLLTVGASAACVALVGSLVRHRGTFVTLVACGALALYPDDIMSAHTLLLEPWMNLLVLAGACVAFRDGRLVSPRRLLWAGVLFGLAGTVKYWAVLPALGLLAVCLLTVPDSGPGGGPAEGAGRPGVKAARAVRFSGGLVAGFAVPVLPFAATWPGLFLRSTLFDQVSRAGSSVPESLRLAHLTGLADLLNDAGQLTVPGDARSLFARGDVTATATWATGWLPVLLAVVLAALLGLGYVTGYARAGRGVQADAGPGTGAGAETLVRTGTGRPCGPGSLEWYALATLGATVAAVLAYSAFFYHYPDFAAPWLAISSGYAAGALRDALAARFRGRRSTPPRFRSSQPSATHRASQGLMAGRGLVAGVAAVLILVAAFQAWELSGLHASDVHADAALIPPGACVVTDEISMVIAANRFTAGSGGCPDVLDSLATTLVTGNGVSVQGGAKALPQVAAEWTAIFSRAEYVWLSGSSDRRIPWTPRLRDWFARHFQSLKPPGDSVGYGKIYVRSISFASVQRNAYWPVHRGDRATAARASQVRVWAHSCRPECAFGLLAGTRQLGRFHELSAISGRGFCARKLRVQAEAARSTPRGGGAGRTRSRSGP